MCEIILSINPEHVENIFNGNKKYEYRKNRCKKDVDKIIIYSTYPIMKVVGEAAVDDILEDKPENIWKKTNKESGINFKFFKEYYEGRQKAVAYKLSNVVKYNNPVPLNNYGLKVAPQSYAYIK